MRLFVYRGMRHGSRPAYMEVSLSYCCFNYITCTDLTVELLNGVPGFSCGLGMTFIRTQSSEPPRLDYSDFEGLVVGR